MAWDSSNCIFSFNPAAWGSGNGSANQTTGIFPSYPNGQYASTIYGSATYGYVAASKLYHMGAATNQGYAVPITSPWDSTKPFSVEINYKPTIGTTSSYPCVFLDTSGNGKHIQLWHNGTAGTNPAFAFCIGANSNVRIGYGNVAFWQGVQHTVVLAFDGVDPVATTSWTIYVDGASVTQATQLITFSTVTVNRLFAFGASNFQPGDCWYFNCYNVALSSTRVADNYALGNDLGLKGYNQVTSMTFASAEKHWKGGDGGGTTDWNNANNWSATNGGAGGAGVPGSTDAVYFDSGSTGYNCQLGTNATCAALYANASWNKNFTTNGYTLTSNNTIDFRHTGTLTFDNTATVNDGGDFYVASGVGTLTGTSGSIVLSKTGIFSCNKAITIINLTLSDSAYETYSTGTGAITVTGRLTMGGGLLNWTGAALSLIPTSETTPLSITAGTVWKGTQAVAIRPSYTGTTTFSIDEIDYTGTGNLSLYFDTAQTIICNAVGVDWAGGDIIFGGNAAGTFTMNWGSSDCACVNFTGNTYNTGTINSNLQTTNWHVTGNWNNGSNHVVDAGTSTADWTSTGTVTITNGVFYTLTNHKSASRINLGSDITVNTYESFGTSGYNDADYTMTAASDIIHFGTNYCYVTGVARITGDGDFKVTTGIGSCVLYHSAVDSSYGIDLQGTGQLSLAGNNQNIGNTTCAYPGKTTTVLNPQFLFLSNYCTLYIKGGILDMSTNAGNLSFYLNVSRNQYPLMTDAGHEIKLKTAAGNQLTYLVNGSTQNLTIYVPSVYLSGGAGNSWNGFNFQAQSTDVTAYTFTWDFTGATIDVEGQIAAMAYGSNKTFVLDFHDAIIQQHGNGCYLCESHSGGAGDTVTMNFGTADLTVKSFTYAQGYGTTTYFYPNLEASTWHITSVWTPISNWNWNYGTSSVELLAGAVSTTNTKGFYDVSVNAPGGGIATFNDATTVNNHFYAQVPGTEVHFKSSANFTIVNYTDGDIAGTEAQPLIFRSTVNATYWNFVNPNTYSVSNRMPVYFVDVKDSNASYPIINHGGTNSGHNVNWWMKWLGHGALLKELYVVDAAARVSHKGQGSLLCERYIIYSETWTNARNKRLGNGALLNQSCLIGATKFWHIRRQTATGLLSKSAISAGVGRKAMQKIGSGALVRGATDAIAGTGKVRSHHGVGGLVISSAAIAVSGKDIHPTVGQLVRGDSSISGTGVRVRARIGSGDLHFLYGPGLGFYTSPPNRILTTAKPTYFLPVKCKVVGSGRRIMLPHATGALLVSSAILSGSGSCYKKGSSAPLASSAILTGSGLDFRGGSGSLVNAADIIVGAGSDKHPASGNLIISSAICSGIGVNRKIGSGNLLESSAILTGSGRDFRHGNGSLLLSSAILTSSCSDKHPSTCSLVSSSCDIAGAGFNSHPATGSLLISQAIITGTGKHGISGSGSLLIASVIIDGLGQDNKPGSGVLLNSSDIIYGAAYNSHVATGNLIPSSFILSGVGINAQLGSGSLILPTFILDGIGRDFRHGNGALVADSATISGSGSVVHYASGSLIRGVNTIVVSGFNSHVATGDLLLNPATTSGLGSKGMMWEGSGNLVSQSSEIVGSGRDVKHATGALVCGSDIIYGEGFVPVVGEGNLIPQKALLLSATKHERVGSGVLVNQGLIPSFYGTTQNWGYGDLVSSSLIIEASGINTHPATGLRVISSASIAGTGRARPRGDGYLVSSKPIITGTGVKGHSSISDLVSQTSIISGSCKDTKIGNGDLISSSCEILGYGLNLIFGTGNLVPGSDIISGTGADTLVGSGSLILEQSEIYGICRARVRIRGNGDLVSGLCETTGYGVRGHSSDSDLVCKQFLINGIGSCVKYGIGELNTDQDEIYGIGYTVIAGNGELVVSPCNISGSGFDTHVCSGDLVSIACVSSGTGRAPIHGVGLLVNKDAILEGYGIHIRVGFGDLQSQQSEIYGLGIDSVVATGDLLSQACDIYGIGLNTVAGHGNLVPEQEEIYGTAENTHIGYGDLVCEYSELFGICFSPRHVKGNGDLVIEHAILEATTARVSIGNGDLEEPAAILTSEAHIHNIGSGLVELGQPEIYGDGICFVGGHGDLVRYQSNIYGTGSDKHRSKPGLTLVFKKAIISGVGHNHNPKATGRLVCQKSLINGIGSDTKLGQGNLVTDSVIDGIGSCSVVGSGELIVPIPEIYGEGIFLYSGDGYLESEPDSIEGYGQNTLVGHGDLTPDHSDIFGYAHVPQRHANGDLVPGQCEIFGYDVIKVTGHGDLVLDDIEPESVASAVHIGRGELEVHSLASIFGYGTQAIGCVSGDLVAQPCDITGFGPSTNKATGNLRPGKCITDGYGRILTIKAHGNLVCRKSLTFGHGQRCHLGHGDLVMRAIVLGASRITVFHPAVGTLDIVNPNEISGICHNIHVSTGALQNKVGILYGRGRRLFWHGKLIGYTIVQMGAVNGVRGENIYRINGVL